jgi:CysZ protein
MAAHFLLQASYNPQSAKILETINMMKGNIFTGTGYFTRGLSLIWKPGIRTFTLWPILITLIVFIVLAAVGVNYFEIVMERFLPSGDSWWATVLRYILWPLLAFSFMLIWYFTFTIIANLIGAPFNGFLAERVEAHLKGDAYKPFDSGSFIKEIAPALLNEIGKISYFLLWAIPLLILFVIPVINIAAPFLWAYFMTWMLTLEYADYPMDNNGIRFKQVRNSLRKRRLTSMGFGGTATLCSFVPILNLLVMPAAVAGATLYWVKEIEADSLDIT